MLFCTVQGQFSRGDPLANSVVIYNRIPKTGSTSFMGMAYELCSTNGFHVIHLNTTKNSHVLNPPDQVLPK
jgi:heparan sulfate 2-O-sulfotransferase HS2ST1